MKLEKLHGAFARLPLARLLGLRALLTLRLRLLILLTLLRRALCRRRLLLTLLRCLRCRRCCRCGGRFSARLDLRCNFDALACGALPVLDVLHLAGFRIDECET